ncbi:MAG: helix-turn-helix domain-containing protein [Ruminococcus callidus]
MANASGLTQASLSRYRNGQRMPETDTLKNLRPESLALQRRTAQIWILIGFPTAGRAAGSENGPHQFSVSFLSYRCNFNQSERTCQKHGL